MPAQDPYTQLLCRVDRWLDTVADTGSNPRTLTSLASAATSDVRERPAKRRRIEIPSPPTSAPTAGAPPTNTMNTSGALNPRSNPLQTPTRPSKRHRDAVEPSHEADPDPDQTPRPPELFRLPSAPASIASSASSSSVASSGRHGRTSSIASGRKKSLSPKKQKVNAEISVYPIQNEPLARIPVDRFPELYKLDTILMAVSDGDGVVPLSLQADAVSRSKGPAKQLFRWAAQERHYYKDKDNPEDSIPAPGMDWVEAMMDRALSLEGMDHDEGAWNMEVHQKILEMAFRSPGRGDSEQLVQFTSCLTAGINPCYAVREPEGSQPVPSKKVDFVLHLNLDHSTEQQAPTDVDAFKQLRAVLPDNTLSHTDYAGLRRNPIAIPIETKRTNEGTGVALLQVGVWQRAHFIFLDRLRRMHGAPNKTAVAEGAGCLPEETSTASAEMQLPEFVPGIIVTGHVWSVVYVTGGHEAALKVWQKRDLGSTEDVLGIWKILRGLHILRRWIVVEYWPAMRKLYVDAML